MQIRIAPDPQLVVCKGNVADRLQKLRTGRSVLGWRCCRASYGTKCKMLHNPKNPAHLGLATERDPLDGKMYVMDCIDWFIKQVCPLGNGLRHQTCQLTSCEGRARLKRLSYCTQLQSKVSACLNSESEPPANFPYGSDLYKFTCDTVASGQKRRYVLS